MKTLTQLSIYFGTEKKTINFGIAETTEELKKMYELRFKVYGEYEYIDTTLYPNKVESDEIDRNPSTKHFIALVDGNIIGTVRVIQSSPLPTEEYFDFKEPNIIASILKNKRAELGRLIAVPFSYKGTYLPRGLIFLFLISATVRYFKDVGYEGGYAFIKESLEKKMKKRKMPLHLIEGYTQKCPEGDALYKYFNQQGDKVVPIYFLTREFSTYTQKTLANRFIFKKERDNNEYTLRTSIYKIFMKLTGAS